MSNRTRTFLGEPEYVIDTILVISGKHALRVWRVWQARDSVIVGALPAETIQESSGELRHLRDSVLMHFFRLIVAEQKLAHRAQSLRRGRGGRAAVRQIDLERRRLGRELHTGAGQMLAAIRMQLEVIARELPAPSHEVQDALDRIGALTGSTLEQVRSVSQRLHPPEWQRLPLREAIRQLWQISGIPQRYEASLELDFLPQEPALEVKVLLYRAMQEALSNLVRHAEASRVSASLVLADDAVTLTMQDNGRGFDPDALQRGPVDVASGIGLRSIREQAEALGGKLTIESGPGGTTLKVSVALFPIDL
jgi:signal transduction histidine kinase